MDIGYRSPQIFEALLEKRQILLQGEINVDIQAKITRLILYLNAINDTPITLFIDSTGGECETGLRICDALSYSQAEIKGVVVAEALSTGFRILQSCHWRSAYPNARLMFHAPAINRRIDIDEWDETLEKSHKLHEEHLNVYAKRSKQTMKQLRSWSKKQKNFTADEALKAGFLDEIIEPPNR